MIGAARGEDTHTHHHVKPYPPPPYRSNSEALAARVVLAHPRKAFHPCTCGLHGGAATVAATLISYDDVEAAVGMTT
jgi:hypothetical protein